MKKSLLSFAFTTFSLLGISQTATLLKDINAGNNSAFMGGLNEKAVLNGLFYFSADDGVNGTELWRTDGTGTNTVLFADIKPGASGSSLVYLTEFNNQLFFFADSSAMFTGPQLWKTDGITTTMVFDFPTSGFVSPLRVCNNLLIFTFNDMGANGSELWVSDGTPTGTSMIIDLNPGNANGAMIDMYTSAIVGNTLFFAGDNGQELWKTDGTVSGTVLVKDINPGSSGSMPKNFVRNGSTIYFRADNATSGSELWKSDGTSSGTVLVKDIEPGMTSSNAEPIDTLGNLVLLRATTSAEGTEPYISNGTSAGTFILADLNPGSQSSLTNPIGVEHATTPTGIYFTAETAASGSEVYKTDGSTAWLHLDVNTSGMSNPANYLLVNNYVYFVADNGTVGSELFRTGINGSSIQNLSDINPGSNGAMISRLNLFNGCLLFSANDGTTGTEPYIYCTNLPPSLSSTTSIDVCMNAGSVQIPFTITDEDANSVTVTGNSSNTTLIQNTGITFTGTGASRTLTATIQPTQSGSSVITITGMDNDSNYVSQAVTINVLPAPTQELCLVTVDSATSNFNQIVWEKPIATDIDSFVVYREITTNVYQRIGAVHYDSLAQFQDTAANPNVTSYRYKISVKDTCGNEGTQGLYHSTIHLQYLGNGNLQWTLYEIESTANPVTFYRVWRDDNSLGLWNPISSTVPGGNTTYTDINYALYPNASYRVDVNWSLSCDPSRAIINTSRSNVKQLAATIGFEEALQNNVSVYVNENDVANFTLAKAVAERTAVELFDATGRLVQLSLFSGNKAEISLNAFADGIYYYRISGGVNANGKLVNGR